jgi:hypothetical protein
MDVRALRVQARREAAHEPAGSMAGVDGRGSAPGPGGDGVAAARAGAVQPGMLERHDRRTLRVFSLGLRWFDNARSHLVSLAPHLLLDLH